MSSGDIVAACQLALPTPINDCAGFVRDVAQASGVLMVGNANELVDLYIERASGAWTSIASELEAIAEARRGKLVIAGLAEPGHGHVIVVVAVRNTVHPNRAYGFWGRYHDVSVGPEHANVGVLHLGHGSITAAWRSEDLAKVKFASIAPSALLMKAAASRPYILR